MGTPTDSFIRLLTSRHRVVVLGGLAVIAHGYSRSTYDGDIWLDPMDSPSTWADAFASVVDEFGGLTMHRLPGWPQIDSSEIADAIEESRVIRILGLDCPLDVFRQPNETATELFDEVFARGSSKADGTILPDPLDLIRSKLDTGRDKDQQDILFLESLVRADYKKRLPIATFEEATAMLDRFSEWQVLQSALENPSEKVKALAHQHLREFAEAGDPFSLAILEGREIP